MGSESNETVHWTDQAATKIVEVHGDKEEYTIMAGITPSGVIHIGNFREIITQELIGRALKKIGKKVRFVYIWDDFDAFRKVPKDAPQQDVLKESLRKPVCKVPNVYEGEFESWARRNEAMVEEALPIVGIFPEFVYQHERYAACDYAEKVKQALQKKDEIRKVLDEFRNDPLPEDWWPISVYSKDWTDDTKVTDYDGEYALTYEYKGREETLDLRKDGRYKLSWRVDWPMRWDYYKVDFESAGKDHGTVGGSFDTGDKIQEKVWKSTPPVHMTYNFIRFKGGDGKMSSSTGGVIALGDVLQIYTPELTRYMFAGTRATAEFAIAFDTEVLQTYEEFDKIERVYYGAEGAKNEKEKENYTRIYELSAPFPDKINKEIPLQPGIRHLTNLVQIFPHDISRIKEYYKDQIKNAFDEERLMQRAQCALHWVTNFAPEEFKFRVHKKLPEELKQNLTDAEKKALVLLGDELVRDHDEATLFEAFGNVCEETGIERKEFFKAAYLVLIGKDKGPKLANLILEIGKEDVRDLLEALD